MDLIFTGKVIDLVEMECDEEKTLPEFLDTLKNRDYYLNQLYPKRFYAKVLIIKEIKNTKVTTDTQFFVSDFTNCDPEYELNQIYLFFANEAGNNKYKMAHCTPWDKLEYATDKVDILIKHKRKK